MSKMEIIEAVKASRTQLLKEIECINPENLKIPATIGKWSIEDILRHIAGWDVWLYTTMKAILEDKQPHFSAVNDFAVTNAQFVKERLNWSKGQILTEMNTVHLQMLNLVRSLTEDQLFKPRMIESTNWALGNFLKIWDEHDLHHAKQLITWRNSQISK